MSNDEEKKQPQLITFEDGVITLGGDEIPGILQSLSVDGKVRFDDCRAAADTVADQCL